MSTHWLVSSPDPTYKRGSGDIRLIPRASLTLITFWREISLRQSHCRKHNLQCNTGNPWLLRHDDTALFLARKLVISCQLCIQQTMNFNEIWGISWMSPYPLCAGGVWGQDYALPDLHVGSHDYFHTPLEGSAPSHSPYKMYGKGHYSW